MKKIISVFLVLMLMASLCIPAFAGEPSPGPTPPSGDNSQIHMWIIVMVVALLAAAVVSVLYFKKARK